MSDKVIGTIWVCVCCMLAHAADGCGCENNSDDAHKRLRDERGRFVGGGQTVRGDGIPLSEITRGYSVAMGMTREEHTCHSVECVTICNCDGECDCDCDDDPECSCDGADECECATDTYSTSQCEGCGTRLHGERHALTLFKKAPRRKPRRPKAPAKLTLVTPAPVVSDIPEHLAMYDPADECYCGERHALNDKCPGCGWPAKHCLCCEHCGTPFGH